jgi:hypothetical protein
MYYFINQTACGYPSIGVALITGKRLIAVVKVAIDGRRMLSKLVIWLCEPFCFVIQKVYGIFAEIAQNDIELFYNS